MKLQKIIYCRLCSVDVPKFVIIAVGLSNKRWLKQFDTVVRLVNLTNLCCFAPVYQAGGTLIPATLERMFTKSK